MNLQYSTCNITLCQKIFFWNLCWKKVRIWNYSLNYILCIIRMNSNDNHSDSVHTSSVHMGSAPDPGGILLLSDEYQTPSSFLSRISRHRSVWQHVCFTGNVCICSIRQRPDRKNSRRDAWQQPFQKTDGPRIRPHDPIDHTGTSLSVHNRNSLRDMV